MIFFFTGAAAFGAWLWLARADTIAARRIAAKSAFFFGFMPIVGILVSVLLMAPLMLSQPDPKAWAPLKFLPGIGEILLVEVLKIWAARTENRNFHSFLLVSLFGIWEIFLKSLSSIWDGYYRIDDISMAALAAMRLLMHILTAAIYSYCLRSRPVFQFAICIAIEAAWVAVSLLPYGFIYLVGLLFGLATVLVISRSVPEGTMDPEPSSG